MDSGNRYLVHSSAAVSAAVLGLPSNWPCTCCWSHFLPYNELSYNEPAPSAAQLTASHTGWGGTGGRNTHHRAKRWARGRSGRRRNRQCQAPKFCLPDCRTEPRQLPSKELPNYFWQQFVALCPLSLFFTIIRCYFVSGACVCVFLPRN